MLKRQGMLRCFCLMCCVLLLSFQTGRASSISVDIRADVGLFYQELAPYGVWVKLGSGQQAWVPTQTPVDWRPYTMGEWSYTQEQGWFWHSAWSWGWAVFHYGRWLFDEEYGWAWVPGGQWAPSWVAWRMGGDMIGWAPLSPAVKLHEGDQQLDDTVLNRDIDIYAWSFVPSKEIFSKSLHAKSIVLSARNVTMVEKAMAATRYEIRDKLVFNYGVDPQVLSDQYKLDIRRTEMVDVTFPAGIDATHLAIQQVAVFRPHVTLKSAATPSSEDGEVAKMTMAELKKRHKALKESLDMYHMLENKSIQRIHEQQAPSMAEQQQVELDSLKRLHAREQAVLKKRIDRESKMVRGR